MEHVKVGLTKTFFFRMGKDMLWMKYSLYSGEWFEVLAQAEIPLDDLGLEMQSPYFLQYNLAMEFSSVLPRAELIVIVARVLDKTANKSNVHHY